MPLQQVLYHDVSLLMERCFKKIPEFNAGDESAEDVALWFRALAKAFMAQVDGITSVMRDIVLKASQLGILDVPSDIEEKLSRVDDVSTDNEEQASGNRPSFLDSLDLTLSQFGRIYQVTNFPRKDDYRFAYFRALVSVRNQITHPERLEDLLTVARLMACFQLGMMWYTEEIIRVLSGGKTVPKRSQSQEKAVEKTARAYLKGIPSTDWSREKTEAFYAEVRRDLGNGFRYAWTMYNALERDTASWMKLVGEDLQDPESSTWIRCLVRSFITEVEGVCAARYKVVQWAYEDKKIKVAAGDVPILEKKRVTLEEKLDVAIRLFPVVYDGTAKGNRSGVGYSKFVQVLGWRDKLTHPRMAADLAVSPASIIDVYEANIWFVEQTLI